ncbi:hypothetical protein C5167_033572 [Papaver somniferum]|uniref:Uncharacterized protein n=1 Tax=Papaver somniferum TaxID=3469 RepID=A0A4Y7KDM3_PAPSO|nr:hypothetical protein C5167_033572 [Papaver somniferum]
MAIESSDKFKMKKKTSSRCGCILKRWGKNGIRHVQVESVSTIVAKMDRKMTSAMDSLARYKRFNLTRLQSSNSQERQRQGFKKRKRGVKRSHTEA